MAEINEIMKIRIVLSIAVMGIMAFNFACGGGTATNNGNSAANKPVSNSGTVVNGPNSSNITVTPVGNTATNTPVNAANFATNSKANAKETANANKEAKPRKGANYLCRDNTYSMSNSDSGACSGHGGVQKPLNNKPQ